MFVSEIVKIDQPIHYKNLEKALIEAAKDMGWRAKVGRYYELPYKVITLKGRILPFTKMKITIDESAVNLNHVKIDINFFSYDKFKEYLAVVSENLKDSA